MFEFFFFMNLSSNFQNIFVHIGLMLIFCVFFNTSGFFFFAHDYIEITWFIWNYVLKERWSKKKEKVFFKNIMYDQSEILLCYDYIFMLYFAFSYHVNFRILVCVVIHVYFNIIIYSKINNYYLHRSIYAKSFFRL